MTVQSSFVSVRDVLIVGAGPSGLATAIAAKQQGLDYAIVEQGVLVNSDLQLPGAHGVLHHAGAAGDRRPAARHPVRQADAARGAALLPPRRRHLPAPDRVRGEGRSRSSPGEADGDGVFVVTTATRQGCTRVRDARAVVLAIGYYDLPNYLGVPGEDLPHVSHYYDDAHPYYRQAGRHRRRQELGGGGRARAVPRWRARHARAPPRRARRLHQVLGAARHREPDQGRIDRGALRDARRRDHADRGRRRTPRRARGDPGRAVVPAHRLSSRRRPDASRRHPLRPGDATSRS